jgi:hypothetical protein
MIPGRCRLRRSCDSNRMSFNIPDYPLPPQNRLLISHRGYTSELEGRRSLPDHPVFQSRSVIRDKGYTRRAGSVDALIFGDYGGGKLIYVGRTRNGFTPATREQLFKRFRGLQTTECPLANLPEEKSGRWGVGLIAAKMKDCDG